MKVVVGQGSCGVATGARKTSDELERLIAEKGLTNVAVDLTGCVGTCYLEPIVDVYGGRRRPSGPLCEGPAR